MSRTRRTRNAYCRRRGILTFEWILLISLLVIGIIGGLSTVRNALIGELHELAESVSALNCGGWGDDCDWGSGDHDHGWHYGPRWDRNDHDNGLHLGRPWGRDDSGDDEDGWWHPPGHRR